ncbi:hypothetical protein RQM65_00715 [Pricia sp. S334]|uniref:Tetratricopeptide repeat protein n=1 Tax=Pricia mediterranea TaxID=3076079 RepID=A0ABU3L0D6_9FLAO|nr:hypothetical protein [Pricia sp. S334]MDT7827182.1 hypothetical protein [Pricia sp. S334]
MKPDVHKDFSGDWRSYFPEEMVSVMDDYYESVEQIDYDEDLAQIGLNKVIKVFPECHIDAYNHLSISNRNQSKTEQALQYAITAYMIGMDSLPNSFNHNHDKLIWLILENRPFLRSLQILGLEFMRRRDLVRAESLFLKLILYNPNDNQGIRYLLAEIYHYTKEKKKLKALEKEYSREDLLLEVFSWKERIL